MADEVDVIAAVQQGTRDTNSAINKLTAAIGGMSERIIEGFSAIGNKRVGDDPSSGWVPAGAMAALLVPIILGIAGIQYTSLDSVNSIVSLQAEVSEKRSAALDNRLQKEIFGAVAELKALIEMGENASADRHAEQEKQIDMLHARILVLEHDTKEHALDVRGKNARTEALENRP